MLLGLKDADLSRDSYIRSVRLLRRFAISVGLPVDGAQQKFWPEDMRDVIAAGPKHATTQTPPPTPQTPPPTTSSATQTTSTAPPRHKATVNSVTTQTQEAPIPPVRTYAEVAVQVSGQSDGGKGKRPAAGKPPQKRETSAETHKTAGQASPPTRWRTRTVVMHAAPLRYKPGMMRRWLEEDNEAVEITGIRWLLKEHAPEKAASSLVIYMRSAEEVGSLRMGRRLFRTTRYEWNRSKGKGERKGV